MQNNEKNQRNRNQLVEKQDKNQRNRNDQIEKKEIDNRKNDELNGDSVKKEIENINDSYLKKKTIIYSNLKWGMN